MSKLQKTKELIRQLPEKKHYVDFLGALLTVPVLITVLMLNLGNLKKPVTQPLSPSPTPSISGAPTKAPPLQVRLIQTSPTPKPVISGACINGIGELTIASPQENQTILTSPVCIDINYNAGNYCGVVWRYRINGGAWSDYGNNSVCLYDLPHGQNIFELQAKSLVSNSVTSVERTFIYNPPSQSVATPTPTLSFTPTPASSTSASQ